MSYTYDSGNLVSLTRSGETQPHWQFGYDASHQMTSMTDGRGKKTTTVYDDEHRVTSQTDALNNTRTWDYSGNQTTIHEPAGDITVEHFANGEPTSITSAAGTPDETTEHIDYNADLSPRTVTDGAGNVTTYSYDEYGNRTSVEDPNHHTTQWTYDDQHHVTSVTTPMGKTTTTVYDAHGNPQTVSRIHHADDGDQTLTTRFTYYSDGQLQNVLDPLQHPTSYAYDADGNLTHQTDPVGDVTTWTYDDDSRPQTEVSPRGNDTGADPGDYTTRFGYDDVGRLKTVTDPLGHIATTVYDDNDNVVQSSDGEGRETTYTFDDADQLTKVTTAAGTTTTDYDADGAVSATYDTNNKKTTYHRNHAEQVDEVTDPLNRSTDMTYDAAGRLHTVTDAGHRVTTYSYDPAGQLQNLAYTDSDTPDVSYHYNADGQRDSMDDGTGHTSYTYDDLGRLTSTTNGHGDTVAYSYDAADRQDSITYPNGHVVHRGYDDADRLDSLTDWLGNTTRLDYDRDSDPTQTTFPTATNDVDQFGYDHADQLGSIQLTHAGTTRASLTYGHNRAGQVTSTTATGLPGTDQAYTYDDAGRLGTANANTLGYDLANNPTAIGDTSAMTYDDAHQLQHATTPAGPTDYSYNGLGERTSTTPTTGAATTYGYDQAGQLTSVDTTGQPTIDYAYDGDGLRTSKTKSDTTSRFSWDTSGDLPLLVAKDDTSYIYDDSGLPIEQIDADGTALFLHHDDLGSTRELTDTSGQVVASFTYDAYGRQTDSTGSASTPFGFGGEYSETDTGLTYLRARYYDPTTGQFLTRDPLEAISGSPYGYAGADPLDATDPTGLLFGSGLVKKGLHAVGSVAAAGARTGLQIGEGALDGATGGYAGQLLGYDSGCGHNWAYKLGFGAGMVGGLADGEGEVALGARGIDEIGSAAKATEGTYEVVTREGLPYVGQSGNIDRRLADHVRSAKISQDAADNAVRTEVRGGKTAREVAEQQRINELTNGVGARDPGIANQRNPIGPARQHLLP